MDLPGFITFMVMWMLLIFGVIAIFLSYRRDRHVIDVHHRERLSALERGLEIPPAPGGEEGASPNVRPAHWLQRGVIYALLGLSLMTALGVNAGARSALWGLPVAAVGLGYLILYIVALRQEKRS